MKLSCYKDLNTEYRSIRNSLTHFTKSIHLNDGNDFNMRPTYTKRNSPSLFVPAAVTSVSICPSAGSDAWPQKTRRCFAGHQDLLTYCLSTACTTGSAWPTKTNHRCHLRNRSWRAAAGIGRLACHKGRTHRALMGCADKTWEISLSFCRSRVTILPGNQVCWFYEMCQGIMSNTVNTENSNKTEFGGKKRSSSVNGDVSVYITEMFSNYSPYKCYIIFNHFIYCILGEAKQTLFSCELFLTILF